MPPLLWVSLQKPGFVHEEPVKYDPSDIQAEDHFASVLSIYLIV